MLPGWCKRFFRLQRSWALSVTLLGMGCIAGGRIPEKVVISIEEWSAEGLTGRRITAEHFEIISTLRDAEFEAALPGFLEATYKQYKAVLPRPDDVNPRLATYVFGTRSEWARFVRSRFTTRYDVYSCIRSGGFTEGNTSVVFYANRAATLATLAHEGWHQYVGSWFEIPIPAWLNEGLACYHEAVEFEGPAPKFTPQHNTFRINSLRDAIQEDRLMSLDEIVDTDAGAGVRHHHSGVTRVYYAQAWALITFLRHGAGGRFAEAFERILNDLADGTFHVRASAANLAAGEGTGLSLGEAAFRAYFGSAPEDLADEYYDHLLQLAGF